MPKPKLIVDKKTGELVEQVREDQLYLGLEPLEEEIDEETGDVVPIQFQYVLRSKLRLYVRSIIVSDTRVDVFYSIGKI